MHETGEVTLPKEAFQQGLDIALDVTRRLQERSELLRESGGSAYVRHIWSDAQTLERIEVLELVGVARNTDPADTLTMPYKNTLLTCRYWDSTNLETEPSELHIKTARYVPTSHTLTIDGYKGRTASAGSIFEPFFELDRCSSSQQKRELLLAIEATGAQDEPEMKRIARKFRGNILKYYTADEITEYAAISDNIPHLPEPISRAKISELATRKLIRDLIHPQKGAADQHILKQIEESVRALDAAHLMDDDIFGSLAAYRMPSLSELLHRRLHSDQCMQTIARLNHNPTAFAVHYMHTILNVHDEKPERRSLANILSQSARAHPSLVIATANAVLDVVNKERAPGEHIQRLQEKGLSDIPQALTILLNITRSGTTEERLAQANQDKVHLEIIAKLLEISGHRRIGQAALQNKSAQALSRV